MPQQQRFWCPFYPTEDAALKNGLAKYAEKKHCKVLAPLAENSLSDMTSDETLIIHGHSKADSLVLTESQGAQGKAITIPVAIQWLVYAGLPKTHVKIRVLGCETRAFAEYLAYELGKLGFDKIVVGGYNHKIFVGSGHRTLVWDPKNDWPEPNTTNSGNVIWYDSKGKATTKPGSGPSSIAEDMALINNNSLSKNSTME